MTTNTNRLVKAVLADANGIDGYTDYTDSAMLFMAMRAALNRHRHAVAFRVKVTRSVDAMIKSMLDKGDYTGALTTLKKVCPIVHFMKSKTLGFSGDPMKSYVLIPNPTLDPYR